jgi:hypothetical protein
MRDEVRRIGPDLYLAMVYERCPRPRCRGIIVLVPEPERHRRCATP